MKTLIKNVTLNGKENSVLIADGKILKISKKINDDADIIIDGKGLFAINGMTNSFFDGTMDDCDKLLSQGITTVFDFSNDIEVTKKLVGLGLRVYSAVGDFDGNQIISEEYLKVKVQEVCNAGANNPILYVLNPNVDDENQYAEMIKFAKKHNYLLATSVSENLEDVGEIDKQYGMSPIALLENYGFLDFKNLLIDCVYVDKDDVNILNNYDTTLCVCPTTGLKNGSGIAPTYSFINNKLNVVIGGNVSSMFQELELCKNLQSGYLNEKDILTNDDVLAMSNINSQHLFDDIGTLKVGDNADIALVDNYNILECTPLNVKLSLCNGNIIYNVLNG